MTRPTIHEVMKESTIKANQKRDKKIEQWMEKLNYPNYRGIPTFEEHGIDPQTVRMFLKIFYQDISRLQPLKGRFSSTEFVIGFSTEGIEEQTDLILDICTFLGDRPREIRLYKSGISMWFNWLMIDHFKKEENNL